MGGDWSDLPAFGIQGSAKILCLRVSIGHHCLFLFYKQGCGKQGCGIGLLMVLWYNSDLFPLGATTDELLKVICMWRELFAKWKPLSHFYSRVLHSNSSWLSWHFVCYRKVLHPLSRELTHSEMMLLYCVHASGRNSFSLSQLNPRLYEQSSP